MLFCSSTLIKVNFKFFQVIPFNINLCFKNYMTKKIIQIKITIFITIHKKLHIKEKIKT